MKKRQLRITAVLMVTMLLSGCTAEGGATQTATVTTTVPTMLETTTTTVTVPTTTAATTTKTTTTTVPTTTATETSRPTKKPLSVATVLGKESNCTVIVNGTDISSDVFAHYNGDYFLLSLFPIARELGCTVTWVNTNTAILESDSNTGLLNTSEKTLYLIDEYGELDTNRDYSTLQFNGGVPGYVPKIVQKVLDECIMDNWSTTASLLPLFPGVRVWEDKEMRTITIQYPAD